jgi:hypothetical protein
MTKTLPPVKKRSTKQTDEQRLGFIDETGFRRRVERGLWEVATGRTVSHEAVERNVLGWLRVVNSRRAE